MSIGPSRSKLSRSVSASSEISAVFVAVIYNLVNKTVLQELNSHRRGRNLEALCECLEIRSLVNPQARYKLGSLKGFEFRPLAARNPSQAPHFNPFNYFELCH